MERISKKLLTSKVLDLGRKNRPGNKRSRTSARFLGWFTEDRLLFWLKYGAILLVPVVILTPEIRLTSPAIRFDEIMIGLGSVLYFLLFLKRKKIHLSVVDYLFAALFVSTAASIVFSYLGIGYKFYFNDLFEFIKLIKYYLMYRIVYDLDWKREDISHLLIVFVISSALAILFSMMQYFNVFGINSMMTFYTKPNHIRAITVAGRVVGTFKNANSWSLFLGGALFFAFGDIVRRLEHKVSGRHYAVVFLLFFAIASMIMTLGRTSIVANFVALGAIALSLWIFPYHDKGRVRISREIFIVFSIFVILSGLAFYSIELIPNNKSRINLVERIEAGLQEAGIVKEGTIEGDFRSWNSRTSKWKNSIILTTKSPIFGYGPSKSVEAKENVPYATDNEYILYLYRYGLLGLALYITFFTYWLGVAFVNIRHTVKKLDSTFVLNVVALGLAVSYPLYNLLAGTFYDFQLFPIFMIFGTLNFYFLRQHEK